ncbi:hypothetical protein L7F22_016830 [Adiantum nelumboides]|nr:hypothetical protein [Adiantum nelumboides]
MADKRDEEGSSSHGTERVSHDEDALFKAQLVSFMETFQQLSRHPKMQELLQASKSPTQTQRASSQSLQSRRQSRSGHMQRKETSKEQRSNDTKGKGHVVEQPPVSIGHRQPSTHGLVNGQDSNEHTMRQTIPLPMSNAGCFGVCRECIYQLFVGGENESCPICKVYLGGSPLEKLRADRQLDEVCAKIFQEEKARV